MRKLHLETVPEFNGTKQPPPTPLSHALRTSRRGLMGYFRSLTPAAPERRKQPRPPTSRAWSAPSSGVSTSCRCAAAIWSTSRSCRRIPKFAADAPSTRSSTRYVDENLEIKLRSTQGMLDWLEHRAGESAEARRGQRAGARGIPRKENALSLDDKQNIVLSRLNQLNDTATRAREQPRAEGVALQPGEVDRQRQRIPTRFRSSRRTPAFRPQGPSWSSCSGRRSSCSSAYGDKHPRVLDVNAQLDDAQRQLDIAISRRGPVACATTTRRPSSRNRRFARNLEGAKSDATGLNRKGIGYGVMEREAKSNREVYAVAADAREGAARLRATAAPNNVRVVDRAGSPAGADDAGGRRTWLMSVVDRAGARRSRVASRPRLHERHDQDAGRHRRSV